MEFRLAVARCCAAVLFSLVAASADCQTVNVTHSVSKGFNLIGNPLDAPIDVVTMFGDAANQIPDVTLYIISVWKWRVDPLGGLCYGGCWEFFTPTQTKAQSDITAVAQGFQPLTTIEAGKGFWVNRSVAAPSPGAPVTLPTLSGIPFKYQDPLPGFPDPLPGSGVGKFSVLKTNAWHLLAQHEALTPASFNLSVVSTPPSPGYVPINFVTLWAWSNAKLKWYFYSPVVEKAGNETIPPGEVLPIGGGVAVANYCSDNGYLDFTTEAKELGPGVGFWVRR
jgi:hypothetical protein